VGVSAVTPSREDFDVVIVGAGFAGLACARSVALRGMRALVIERSSAEKRVIRTTGLLVKEAAERWEAMKIDGACQATSGRRSQQRIVQARFALARRLAT
jgi:2-polyprenyl-6-methoxyphenol hydroxylase-like FAD-dependent oxidoreductase